MFMEGQGQVPIRRYDAKGRAPATASAFQGDDEAKLFKSTQRSADATPRVLDPLPKTLVNVVRCKLANLFVLVDVTDNVVNVLMKCAP